MGCLADREKVDDSKAPKNTAGDLTSEPPSAMRTSESRLRRLKSSRAPKKDYKIIVSDDKESTLDSLAANWTQLDARVEYLCRFEGDDLDMTYRDNEDYEGANRGDYSMMSDSFRG